MYQIYFIFELHSTCFAYLSSRHCCLLASKQTAVSECCCMYSLELLMMDGKTVRNMQIVIPKEIKFDTLVHREPGSSVGIATELRAGRSGIESRWGRDFPPVQTGPGSHPSAAGDVLLTTHPLLGPRSWKSRAILLPTLWATPGL